MIAESYRRLARKTLTESLRVKKGETVTIETWNNGLPFASTIVLEARRIGAKPLLLVEEEKAFIKSTKTVPRENLGSMGRHEYALLSETDAYVFIPGPPIAGFTKSLTSEARSAATSYNVSWYETAAKAKLRGVRLSFGYLGNDFAALLRKDKNSVVEHLIDASLCDYKKIRSSANLVLKGLTEPGDAKVISDGHRLEFRFEGDATIEDGVVDEEDIKNEHNVAYIPPGLVSRAVDPKSANGSLKFSAPITRYGRIPDITMRFKDGKITEWSSKQASETLNRLLDTIPENKKTVTMAGVGLNPVLKYGYSQDRFVAGAITVMIGPFTLTGIVSSGNLGNDGRKIVEKGKLVG